MFYPIDLLSRRRKGKLAHCWLAGVTNEKLFKKYYSSIAIKKMNVIRTCEEILQVIQIQNGRTPRFSLYLSSQLMCGITRIHFYQIRYYQKEVLEIQQKFKPDVSSKEIPAIRDVDSTTEPLLSKNLYNAQLDEGLHILPGEIPDGRLQVIMQDANCVNFGALTDEELDLMLQYNGDFMLELKDRMQITNNNKEDNTLEEMADIEIVPKVYRDKPFRIERSSVTPKPQSCQSQMETPTKRRRLSVENAAEYTAVIPVPLEDVIAPTTVFPIIDSIPALVEEKDSLQADELDIKLESLHSCVFEIKEHTKRRKIIDKRITLHDKILKQWRDDIKIHCRQFILPQIHSPIPAIELLSRPSHWPMRWSSNLRALFMNRITGSFKSRDEDFTSTKLMQSQEIIRLEETTSKLDFPTEEFSELGKTYPTITNTLDSIQNILPLTKIADIIPGTHEASTISLSETGLGMITLEEGISTKYERSERKAINHMDDTDETFLEDIETLLEKQRRSSRARDISIFSTIASSSETSRLVQLTKHEILALLEVFWSNQQYIKFSELVPDTYTRADAATVFHILLELHAQKKLVLQQTVCYHTLWIQKYEAYLG